MNSNMNDFWLSTQTPRLADAGTTWAMTAFLTAVLLTAMTVYHLWTKREFYRLAAKIPGPPTFPLIGNALDFLSLDHSKVLGYLANLMKEYNGVARVWLGQMLVVHVSKAEDLEIVLTSSKLIDKNVMYKFFDDILGNGLLNSSGELWKKHRRIIAPTFHPSVLRHFISIFEQESKTLVEVLDERCGKGSFDVFPYIRNCALDLITETALEKKVRAQEETVSSATEAAERLMNITFNRMFKLWMFYDFIFYWTREGREYIRLRNLVKQSTEPLLEAKKKEVAELEMKTEPTLGKKIRRSFFRHLVKLNEDGEKFNDKEVRDEVMTIIITGYETSAATVSFVLVMLGIHQQVQDQVYQEVLAMQEELKGRDLELEDLSRFEYLDRVIKETLRLYPVGPCIFRQSAANVPLTTCTIPKGASVAILILRTHRDPAYWDEPDKFNPDNFLPEKVENRHPYAFVPFSAGPRNCIGQKYAYLSMKVMIYYLLSKYRVVCDMKPEDVKMKNEVTLKMMGGFNITLEPRTKGVYVL